MIVFSIEAVPVPIRRPPPPPRSRDAFDAIVLFLIATELKTFPPLMMPPASRALLSEIVLFSTVRLAGLFASPKFWIAPASPPPVSARFPEIVELRTVSCPVTFEMPPPEEPLPPVIVLPVIVSLAFCARMFPPKKLFAAFAIRCG